MRAFISLLQSLTVVLLFDAPFPEPMLWLGRVLSTLSLGVELASPHCAGLPSGYYATFSTTVLLLFVVCVGMMIAPLREMYRNGDLRRLATGGVAFRDLFAVVIATHPGVSGLAMKFFHCRQIDGVYYLRADYSIVCYDSTWLGFLPVALFVILCFALGTPIMIWVTLNWHKDTLYDEDGKFIPQPLDILFKPFKPHAYYFTAVQMASELSPHKHSSPAVC